MSARQALHFVLKIALLKQNLEFFRDKLGMTVLRHEVFDEGCEAACNGPYSNKWSKTMIGYGPEDDHFVLELTYNYSVGRYNLGNDLQYIKLALNRNLFEKLKGPEEPTKADAKDTGVKYLNLTSPDGYKFIITQRDKDDSKSQGDVTEVCLSCSSLDDSIKYWTGLLKMEQLRGSQVSEDQKEVFLKYSEHQAGLRLKQVTEKIDHKSAFGRIAFSCPADELKPIQKAIEDAKQKVLTPFLSLDTPGKASVQVVILADPDGHEICFVGDEGFRELSKVDRKANELIEKSILEDKSEEWYQRQRMLKKEE